jgi:hypothetical protein
MHFEHRRNALAILAMAGIYKPGDTIVQILTELDQATRFVKDEFATIGYAKHIEAHHRDTLGHKDNTPLYQGLLLSDIGKGGDGNMCAADRALVTRMYAVEGVQNPDQQTLRNFFHGAYAVHWNVSQIQAGSDALDFEAIVHSRGGLLLERNLDMSLRTFWSSGHILFGVGTIWGAIMNEQSDILPQGLSIAALHHVLEGIDGLETAGVGKLHPDARITMPLYRKTTGFSFSHALCIVLDKYDAHRMRAGKSHVQAIEAVRAQVASSINGGPLTTLLDDSGIARAREHFEGALDHLDALSTF